MITTGRTAFRYAIEKALTGGTGGLTRECRLADAEFARRCRNIFFNAVAPPILQGVASPLAFRVDAQTRPFGFPIIVVDALNFRGNLFNLTYWQEPNALVRLYSTQDATRDFFGTGAVVDAVQVFSHDRNRFSPTAFDGPSNRIHFCPYLLRPGEMFKVEWTASSGLTLDVDNEVDFRGVVILPDTDPYVDLCGRLKEEVCRYVNDFEPETVILDITIPFGGLTVPREFVTEPQSRPLLVYGIGTSMSGGFVQIRDPATQWTFTAPGDHPRFAIDSVTGLVVTFNPPVGQGFGVPLYLAASNSNITNRDTYNMLAVPHLLESNTSLYFRLVDSADNEGLFANGVADETPGRISLLCRTV